MGQVATNERIRFGSREGHPSPSLARLSASAAQLDAAFRPAEQESALRNLEQQLAQLEELTRHQLSLVYQEALVRALTSVRNDIDTLVIQPKFTARLEAFTTQVGTLVAGLARSVEEEVAPFRKDIAAGGEMFDKELRRIAVSSTKFVEEGAPTDVFASLVLALPEKPRNGTPIFHGFHSVCRTPVRSSLRALDALSLSREDTLVQLGSGCGDFVALAAAVSNAGSVIGLELDSTLVKFSRSNCAALRLVRAQVVQGDPRSVDFRMGDLSKGNKFFLDAPYYGNVLKGAVRNLLAAARQRPITVVTTGPIENLEEISGGNLRCAESSSRAVITYHSKRPSEIRMPEDRAAGNISGERIFAGTR